ncbi:MAG: M13 family metallopeptidase [Thalassolituus sp.]|uniref:M13 family metallopeptidase n=1 Tax=Thalassolituus sp. TaxID=2030822 RepID=UPI003981BA18
MAIRAKSLSLFIPLIGAISVGLTGCEKESAETTTAIESKAELGHWGVETKYISSTVKPGDDFFTYVNEGWLESAEFPPGVPRIDSFVELTLKAESDIREIIADASANAETSNQSMIAAMYASYMDVERLNELGISPLQGRLSDIIKAQDHDALVRLMQRPGYTGVVGMGVVIDTRDPSRYIMALQQGGLALPSREYYLTEGEPYSQHRAAYKQYISDLFSMADLNDWLEQVPAIIKFETALAEAHWSNAEMRDPVRMSHYMTMAELGNYAPGIDWLEMTDVLEAGLTADTTVLAGTDSALKKTAAIYRDTPLEVIKAYMVFHLLNGSADLLGEEWKNRKFAFYGTRLQGLKEQRSREKDAINLLNASLGEVVGKEYVAKHFPPQYREVLMTYISYLRDAFRERLTALEWMDEATRKEAIKKLSMLHAEIGYPTRWHDYSALRLKADDLIGNIQQIEQWVTTDAVKKLNEPVRDWEWGADPQEINAYYSASRNEIVFLAAILQPPFFDPAADFAVNFGAILGVIGHETSHGFDDQGSQYDGTGLLRNWWSEASRKEFNKRGDQLVAQFDSYEPIPGAHVNGRLTLGENIADLGGVSVAYHALQKYIADHYPDGAPELDGFTAEQRFFLAWAQMWRGKRTEDYARELLLRDPHSPSRYRANGTVRNLDAWYEAFNVGPEADLFLPKDQRITTW